MTITNIIPQFTGVALSETIPSAALPRADSMMIKPIASIGYGGGSRAMIKVMGYMTLSHPGETAEWIALDLISLHALRQILQGAIVDDQLIVFCQQPHAHPIHVNLSDGKSIILTPDQYINQGHVVARVLCHTPFRLATNLTPTRTFSDQ